MRPNKPPFKGVYRGTSLIRKSLALGPCLGGGGLFLISEIPLYPLHAWRPNTPPIFLNERETHAVDMCEGVSPVRFDVMLYAKGIELKPFWQSRFLHECVDMTSKEQFTFCIKLEAEALFFSPKISWTRCMNGIQEYLAHEKATPLGTHHRALCIVLL